MEQSGRESLWLPARPRVLILGYTLQLSSPRSVTFYKFPTFLGQLMQAASFCSAAAVAFEGSCCLIRSKVILYLCKSDTLALSIPVTRFERVYVFPYPQARASAKKFRKVTLTVSPKGIIITDTETTDLVENVSIYR